MADVYNKDELDRRMNGAVATLKSEMAGLRTGRASAALLDPVKVEAYGNTVPINQVGTISTPEARMITVQVWDKGLAKAVDKAIRDAGLGLNPQMDGQLLRIPLPELNQERRKELSKLAAKYAEAARVAVRNVRRDGMDLLKRLEKDGKIGQDDHHTKGDELQKLTDAHIKDIDTALHSKEQEIMQVDEPGDRRHLPICPSMSPSSWTAMAAGRRSAICRARPAIMPAWSAVRETVRAGCDMGLENLTLFAFSSENWKRPKTEVGALMGLFRAYFRSDMDELVERNVRMRIIGHRGRVANDIQQMIQDSESRTANNTGMNLTFAFDYGGQEEIAAAARELARAATEGRLDPETITPELFAASAFSPARCRSPTW